VPRRDRPAGRPTPAIADRGRAAAAMKIKATGDMIRQAMRLIERDIESNGGVYPYADGRVSLQEVIRRAGLRSPAVLEKPRHEDLKAEVQAWLATVTKRVARGAKVVRRMVTERCLDADQRLRDIKQAVVELELEHVDEIAERDKRIKALTDEVASLRRQLEGATVLRLADRKE
jgi:uncharacterized membrane protein YccC